MNSGGDGSYSFPTYHGDDLYAVCNDRELYVFKALGEEDHSWERVAAEMPSNCCRFIGRCFLMKCDQHLLLVIVGSLGESVEVFRFNDSMNKWEKIDRLGKHVISICDTTCLCIEAKTPEMENKIFFHRLYNEKIHVLFTRNMQISHT